MKRSIYLLLTGLGVMFLQSVALAQLPTYMCDIRSPAFVSDNVYEFDLYITRSGTIPLELANYQAGIQVNPLLVNGGTITASIVASSSGLAVAQQPVSVSFVAATNCIRLAPKAPPRELFPGSGTSVTSGTIIADGSGTKICRIRLTNSGLFGHYPLSPVWNFTVNPYNTIVSAFVGPTDQKVNTIITSPGSIGRNLSVTAFLEGPYNPSTSQMNTTIHGIVPLSQPFNTAPWNYTGTEVVTAIPADVTDWILVDLRDASSASTAFPSTSKAMRAYFLKMDGSIVDLDGVSAPNLNFTPASNLFAVVRHRHHIAVMSANGLTLGGSGYDYNFSTSLSQAYNSGAGYKEIATGVFGMVAGDADADGSIYPSDYNQWAAKYNTAGYLNSDFDMDSNVYPSDYNKWASNYNTGNPISKSLGLVTYISQVPGDN
jgi:hypothetical protein